MNASKNFRNSKVRYFDSAVLRNQQILQLDVTMSNAIAMEVIETLNQLFE